MKKILFALLALLAVPSLNAQGQAKRITMLANYDLDSASYIYCNSLGISPGAGSRGTGEPMPRGVRVATVTTGSTTISAVTAGTKPFVGMVAGDILYFEIKGFVEERVIVTATDDDNTVVNRTINLHSENTGVPAGQGVTFRWRQRSCGTAATDGWMDVTALPVVKFEINIDQMNVTGNIDVRVECQSFGAVLSPQQVFLDAIATAGIPSGRITRQMFWTDFDQCRVGLKLTTDDGGDTGANAEQISIIFTGADYER